MERILAIDFGVRRVGLAINDLLGITAQSLETIVYDGKLNILVDKIEKIVDNYNIQKVVVGYPKNMNGTISETAKIIDIFIENLLKKKQVEIVRWDERLTTVMAHNTMNMLNIKNTKKKSLVDKISANIIMQSYLQYNYNSSINKN